MQGYFTLLCVVFVIPFAYQSSTTSPSGSVNLDELSFHKVINKFEATLVKFDVAYPYGDKHDAFVAVARSASDVDDLLLAEVGVKDYGEKENEALALKYGASKDNFPVVKLFVKGKSEPLSFDGKRFTSDEIRRFIRENTGIYLSLPGCVRELDLLAIKFMKSKDETERKLIIKEVEEIEGKLPEKSISSGKIYKTLLQKVLENGNEFIATEYTRVKKLQNGKLSNKKKKELEIRLNILQTFKLQKNTKNEL